MAKTVTVGSAWTQATEMAANLRRGGQVTPVSVAVSEIQFAPGEYAVADIAAGLTFARYCAIEAPATRTRPTVVVGSVPFVSGFLLGSVVKGARLRRRARRQSAAQWRTTELLRVVMTSHRLRCLVLTSVGPSWRQFDYDTVTDLRLDRPDVLRMWFAASEPLRLEGELAAWCAVVIAHFRFGTDAPRHLAALHG